MTGQAARDGPSSRQRVVAITSVSCTADMDAISTYQLLLAARTLCIWKLETLALAFNPGLSLLRHLHPHPQAGPPLPMGNIKSPTWAEMQEAVATRWPIKLVLLELASTWVQRVIFHSCNFILPYSLSSLALLRYKYSPCWIAALMFS